MLVLAILAADSDEKKEISDSDLFDSLQTYQWGIEREIVSRITGIPAPNDERSMLLRLERISIVPIAEDDR